MDFMPVFDVGSPSRAWLRHDFSAVIETGRKLASCPAFFWGVAGRRHRVDALNKTIHLFLKGIQNHEKISKKDQEDKNRSPKRSGAGPGGDRAGWPLLRGGGD